MTEHTPTPWRVKNEEAIKIADSKGDSILSMYHTHLRGRRPTNEVEANAAFIVKAVNNHDALVEALRAFVVHATYPVSTEINPRGYAWRNEGALDYAKGLADAVLDLVGSQREQT